MEPTKEEEINQNIQDINKLHPCKLLLTKKELATLRNVSVSTINREKAEGAGVVYKENRGQIMYPVREIAIWLCNTIKTN